MKRTMAGLLLALFFLGVLVVSMDFAQSSELQSFKLKYEKKLEYDRGQIAKWQSQKSQVIALAIILVGLGASVAALQQFNKAWIKTATIVLGVVISIATAVNEKIFPLGSPALAKIILDGRAVTSRLEDELTRTDIAETTADALKEWMANVKGLQDQFDSLERSQIAHFKPRGGPGFELVPALYAEPQAPLKTAPGWTLEAPLARDVILMAGIGDDREIMRAKDSAFAAAKEAAADYFTAYLETTLEPRERRIYNQVPARALALKLVDAAEVKDSYFYEFSGGYRYYVLLQFYTKELMFGLDLATSQQKLSVPPYLMKSFNQLPALLPGYYRGVIRSRQFFLEGVARELPEELAGQLTQARLLRVGSKAEAALPILTHARERYPESLFILFEAAKTYEAIGDLPAAAKMFDGALRLAKGRGIKYSPLHFCYGLLLTRMGEAGAARDQFQEYLRLVPEDELIQRFLKARK